MEKALTLLVEELCRIEEEHEEVTDTAVREAMGDAIHDAFVIPVSNYELPETFEMFSQEGDERVKAALASFLAHPEVIAAAKKLEPPQERLAAFQDGLKTSETYFGWSDPKTDKRILSGKPATWKKPVVHADVDPSDLYAQCKVEASVIAKIANLENPEPGSLGEPIVRWAMNKRSRIYNPLRGDNKSQSEMAKSFSDLVYGFNLDFHTDPTNALTNYANNLESRFADKPGFLVQCFLELAEIYDQKSFSEAEMLRLRAQKFASSDQENTMKTALTMVKTSKDNKLPEEEDWSTQPPMMATGMNTCHIDGVLSSVNFPFQNLDLKHEDIELEAGRGAKLRARAAPFFTFAGDVRNILQQQWGLQSRDCADWLEASRIKLGVKDPNGVHFFRTILLIIQDFLKAESSEDIESQCAQRLTSACTRFVKLRHVEANSAWLRQLLDALVALMVQTEHIESTIKSLASLHDKEVLTWVAEYREKFSRVD